MQTTTDYVGGAEKALARGKQKPLLLYNRNAVWQLHKTTKGGYEKAVFICVNTAGTYSV